MDDAMKEALKRKLQSLSGDKHGLEIDINLGNEDEASEDQADPEEMSLDKGDMQSDEMAPSLGKQMPGQMMPGSQDDGGGDMEKMELLKAFSDGAPQGRAPASLRERAAMNAQGKLGELAAKMKK